MLPVAISIINPAVRTPAANGGNAFLNGICKKLATNDPTQAPVVGIGTATNMNNPKAV